MITGPRMSINMLDVTLKLTNRNQTSIVDVRLSSDFILSHKLNKYASFLYQIRKMKELIQKELDRTNGVLFGQTMLVGRGSYKGRNILAPNSALEDRDDRGYYLVERWIMSIIQTENPAKINGEGLYEK